jgi:putative transposase
MKRRRHTPEQIIRKLRRPTGCWPRAMRSPRSPSSWRSPRRPITAGAPSTAYGGLKADDVKRLKELETENARLKQIVADKELQIEALKELGRGNW